MNHIDRLRGLIEGRWTPIDVGGMPKLRRAAFILCPARSGSTLLRVMLGGSPELFAPEELDLASIGADGLGTAGYSWMNRGAIRAIAHVMGVDPMRVADTLHEHGLMKDGVPDAHAVFELIQMACAPRMLVDKSIWYPLDKRVLERIESEFEDPLYIHLLRHPCGTIHSFSDLNEGFLFCPSDRGHVSPDRDEFAEAIWTVCHENIVSFLSGIPAERKHSLRFEDLVIDPRSEMLRLSEFLGVPFARRMLTPYDDPVERMAQPGQVGDMHFHNWTGISPGQADRWKGHVTKDLEPQTRRLMELFGYKTDV